MDKTNKESEDIKGFLAVLENWESHSYSAYGAAAIDLIQARLSTLRIERWLSPIREEYFTGNHDVELALKAAITLLKWAPEYWRRLEQTIKIGFSEKDVHKTNLELVDKLSQSQRHAATLYAELEAIERGNPAYRRYIWMTPNKGKARVTHYASEDHELEALCGARIFGQVVLSSEPQKGQKVCSRCQNT